MQVISKYFPWCLAGICIFCQPSLAQSSKVDSEKYLRDSETWPEVLREFLRVELVYGDHRVDKDEAEYAARSLSRGTFDTTLIARSTSVGSLVPLFDLLEAGEGIAERCIESVAREDGTDPATAAAEWRLADNALQELDQSLASDCQAVVDSQGQTTVPDESLCERFFVQLLRRDELTPASLKTFLRHNPAGMKAALNALEVSTDHERYVWAIADLLLEDVSSPESIRWSEAPESSVESIEPNQQTVLKMLESMRSLDTKPELLLLAEMAAYISIPQAARLLDRLDEVCPKSRRPNGAVVHFGVMDSVAGALDIAIYSQRDHLAMRTAYETAKDEERLLGFFSEERFRLHPGIKDKAWLLCRYHTDLVPRLIDEWTDSGVDVYAHTSLESVLVCTLSYGRLYPLYAPWLATAERRIRAMAYESEEAVGRVKGLTLLEPIATDRDVWLLRNAATDVTEVSWRRLDIDMSGSGPLVAQQAIRCLLSVGSAQSRAVLEQVATDDTVNESIRSAASKALANRSWKVME